MKKAIVFSFLTILLILLVVFEGIPFLTKMAAFFEGFKSATELVETKDVTPPSPPRLRPLTEATNSARIVLRGFAEPGATVKIFLNGEIEAETVTAADGSFSSEDFSLSLGKNRIKAIAVDQAGNKSKDSGTMIIVYDKTPPELDIETPKNNTSFSGDEKKVVISGKTSPEASLKINDRLIILDQEGKFSYSLTLSEGENHILIKAKDPAGNETQKELTLTFSP